MLGLKSPGDVAFVTYDENVFQRQDASSVGGMGLLSSQRPRAWLVLPHHPCGADIIVFASAGCTVFGALVLQTDCSLLDSSRAGCALA